MKFEAKFLSMFSQDPSKFAAYEFDLQAKLIRRNNDLDSTVGGSITSPYVNVIVILIPLENLNQKSSLQDQGLSTKW